MKTPPSDRRFLQAERVFLHEISSPLMLAEGWLERWGKTHPAVAKEDGFKQVKTQIEKMRNLLNERREQLIALERDED